MAAYAVLLATKDQWIEWRAGDETIAGIKGQATWEFCNFSFKKIIHF